MGRACAARALHANPMCIWQLEASLSAQDAAVRGPTPTNAQRVTHNVALSCSFHLHAALPNTSRQSTSADASASAPSQQYLHLGVGRAAEKGLVGHIMFKVSVINC
eukprot:357809-Chlamydomonas_euryale.AAC.5